MPWAFACATCLQFVACGGNVGVSDQIVDGGGLDSQTQEDVVSDAVVDGPMESDGDATEEFAAEAGDEDAPDTACSDCWLPTSHSGAPLRERAVAVWTGQEVLVYGGGNWFPEEPSHLTTEPTGVLYRPDSDSWKEIPAGPTAYSDQGVWSGEYLLVPIATGTFQGESAWFTPGAGVWEHSYSDVPSLTLNRAVWVSGRALLWGGKSSAGNCGAVYDPGSNTWTSIVPPDLALCRGDDAALVAVGYRMFVWGGSIAGQVEPSNIGAMYDPLGDAWVFTSTEGAPTGRKFPRAVWTGSEVIVWGGAADSGNQDAPCTGAVYSPVQNEWRPISSDGSPPCDKEAQVAWGDGRMFVWMGGGAKAPGAIYDPDKDKWTVMSISGSPRTGIGTAVVWMGTELMLWGGREATWTGDSRGWLYRPPPK